MIEGPSPRHRQIVQLCACERNPGLGFGLSSEGGPRRQENLQTTATGGDPAVAGRKQETRRTLVAQQTLRLLKLPRAAAAFVPSQHLDAV